MKKRILILALCVLLLLPLLVACKGSEPTEEEKGLMGMKFVHDKSFFSKKTVFSILLNEDKTFVYSESLYSTYLGRGTWEIKNGILTLTEEGTGKGRSFSFEIRENSIVYIAKKSDAFPSAKVEDGDTFSVLQDIN